MRLTQFVAGAALAAAFLPSHAQEMKTIDGLVINLGLMSAQKAVHAAGHRDMHPDRFPSGSEHVLITLTQAKIGRPIGDAAVEVEVVDPKGRAEKKALLRTSAGGAPDYSELFQFGWSGKYSVRVHVTPTPGAKPVKATFTVNHRL